LNDIDLKDVFSLWKGKLGSEEETALMLDLVKHGNAAQISKCLYIWNNLTKKIDCPLQEGKKKKRKSYINKIDGLRCHRFETC
jgi:hypothetical protein